MIFLGYNAMGQGIDNCNLIILFFIMILIIQLTMLHNLVLLLSISLSSATRAMGVKLFPCVKRSWGPFCCTWLLLQLFQQLLMTHQSFSGTVLQWRREKVEKNHIPPTKLTMFVYLFCKNRFSRAFKPVFSSLQVILSLSSLCVFCGLLACI